LIFPSSFKSILEKGITKSKGIKSFYSKQLNLPNKAQKTKYVKYSKVRNMKPGLKELYPQLKKIESEIQILKVLVIKSKKLPKQKAVLEGVLKGIKIEEKDIEEA